MENPVENLDLVEEQAERPPAAQCLAQVERIIRSPEFDATEREGRFLRYVVSETLAGNASRIKAYSIAVAVLGRKETFDPQTDPIVRIEAGRLRRALERYYLTAGASDPLVITIPKGHYVPVFSLRGQLLPSEAAPPAPGNEPDVAPGLRVSRRWPAFRIAAAVGLLVVGLVLAYEWQTWQPSAATPEPLRVEVTRFEDLNRTEASADIANGLTQEVIAQLSRFRDITVIESDAARVTDPTLRPLFSLNGSISLTDDGFRLRVRLVQRPDGAVLWSETYEGDLTVAPLVEAQADIADKVAMQLGQSYGAIFLADDEFKRVLPPDDWAAYSCVLSFYSVRSSLEWTSMPEVQKCLEKTVDRFPNYSTAWAMLSLIRLDGIRTEFPHDPATFRDRLDRAFADAERSIALDPQNVRALQAEMLALFWDKQFALAQVIGDRALALNPNDTELLGDYGYRLAQSGSWEKGCAMIRKASQQDLPMSTYYNPGLALCAYFNGNMTEAISYARAATQTTNQLGLLVALIVYAEAGNLVEADRLRRRLDEINPALLQNIRQEVSLRLGRPQDVERVLQTLKKVGIPDIWVQGAQQSPGN